MRRRMLGKSGISVAPLALGGNVFGWTIDERTSFAVLDAFVDAGFDLIDTANVYSMWAPGNKGGESEKIIGRWLKQSGKRDKIVLATKVGKPLGKSTGLRREHIVIGVEESLQRLNVDTIDLYQSHADDLNAPLDETLSAFDMLIRQGKVRAIGASNYSAERLEESLAVSNAKGFASYVTLQPEYNLYDRKEFEESLLPVCLKHEISVISYYSLANGFLSGKYRSNADLHQSVRGTTIGKRYLNDRGFRILQALDRVAEAHDTAPAVVAIAWLIHRPSIAAPIVSATSTAQLNDLINATQLELSADQMSLLDAASSY